MIEHFEAYDLTCFVKDAVQEGVTLELSFKVPPSEISVEEVSKDREQKIDSTGNLLWPAEELLSRALLEDSSWMPQTNNIRIVELGSGYSGLAGLCSTVKALASKVKNITTLLTDGNHKCGECRPLLPIDLNINASMNKEGISTLFKNSTVQIQGFQFNWSQEMKEHFEEHCSTSTVVLGADILFFRDYHQSLLHVLRKLLVNPQSLAILICPDRDGTLQQFVKVINSEGHLQVVVNPLEKRFSSLSGIISTVKSSSYYCPNKHDLFTLDVTLAEHQKTPNDSTP